MIGSGVCSGLCCVIPCWGCGAGVIPLILAIISGLCSITAGVLGTAFDTIVVGSGLGCLGLLSGVIPDLIASCSSMMMEVVSSVSNLICGTGATSIEYYGF